MSPQQAHTLAADEAESLSTRDLATVPTSISQSHDQFNQDIALLMNRRELIGDVI